MSTTSASALGWLPAEARGFATLPAGVHGWDALLMPRWCGEHVIALLGERSGAVIEDGFKHILYWLIPPGSADSWQPPAGHGIEIRGVGSYVTVPGTLRSAWPCWRRVPTESRCLTDPGALKAAIDTACGPRGGRT